MIGFYLKSAGRSIQRRKSFSLLNMIGLSVGITVFLLTLEYYNYETGFNRFHKNLPDLYRVVINANNEKAGSENPMISPMMKKDVPGIRECVRVQDNFSSGSVISYLPEGREATARSFQEENCLFVDKSFLDAFSFPLLEGVNQLDQANTVIITKTIAEKLFNKESALGKTIILHNQFGTLPCKVTGVALDPPVQSDIQFACLFPIETLNNAAYTNGSDWARLDNWGNDSYSSFVWAEAQADPARLASLSSELYAKARPDYQKKDGSIQLQPVSEMHLGRDLKDDNPVFGSMALSYFILALGILILCIAWINYINFSTAFAISQAKNIGIHKVIGSTRSRIVGRYITEAFLLNGISLVLALLLTNLIQPLFNYISARNLSLAYIGFSKGLLYASFIWLAGILICGSYVGLVLARFKPLLSIQYNDRAVGGGVWLRKALLVFQFGIAFLFISATIIINRQLHYMKTEKLGMNIENLVVIDGPRVRTNDSLFKINEEAFGNELRKIPFIEKISQTGSVPGIGSSHNFSASGITKPGAGEADANQNYFISIVDDRYFDTYQIPIIKGRNFRSSELLNGFKGDKIMLNEAAARQLGYKPEDAINQPVHWDKSFQIIGVVKNYHHRSLKEAMEPIIFVPQKNDAHFTLQMDLHDLSGKMARIKTLYESAYPGNPFVYHILRDTYDQQYAFEQRGSVLVLSLSFIVVLIASLGLIGLSVFSANRRMKEVGVRKLLGASIGSLFFLLSREFLMLVSVSTLIAAPIGWMLMNKWLLNFAFRINLNVWNFLLAAVLGVLIALFTVSFQCIQAAVVNPIRSLKSE